MSLHGYVIARLLLAACFTVLWVGVRGQLRYAPADSLLLDALGQVYAWGADQTLVKHHVANPLAGLDTLRYRFRQVQLGPIASVDLTNPLRPLVFYGDAQRVVWLERNLTELRGLTLFDLGLGAVDAVAYAPNDGLWVYAPDRQQLLLVDRQNRIAQASPTLNLTFGAPIRARQLAATPRQVALLTDDGRVLLFDAFASYRKQLRRPAEALVASEGQLLFAEGGVWYRYGGAGGLVERVATDSTAGRLLMLRGNYALFGREGRARVHQLSGQVDR